MSAAAFLAALALHFSGLISATTCVPGPVGGDRMTSYHLRWKAATGAPTVVYRIYQATAAGRENFAKPTYVTRAVGFTTPPLPSSKAYWFVVRAGSADRNRIERRGVNLCV
ncbi:MAG TPA: hypothetical protein VKP14_04615 [Gaiellaceae bacterium]|nr:hypothetical protein [Gaiellaceae bacterium]